MTGREGVHRGHEELDVVEFARELRGARASGLDPRAAQAVLVKSAGQFRGFYTAIAARILELDTPGPVDGVLTRLPFRNLTRPLWPFDAGLETPW